MKRLPVPPLEQTLLRYLDIVEPLLDDAQMAGTRRAVRVFADGDGPGAQAALEHLAETEHAAGRNWMSEAWLGSYLTGRENLTLLSNVAFQLTWHSPYSGAALAADVIRRLAAVHLAHIKEEIEPDVSPRGETLCMQQFRYLAGGIRMPRHGTDVIVPGPAAPTNREVIVLWRGHACAVRVSDEQGRLACRPAIEQAVADVVGVRGEAKPPFTAPGYLAGDAAATWWEAQSRTPERARTQARLRDALFLVHLTDDERSLEEQLARTVFGAAQTWPFKPVTAQVSLAADRFVALHVEHSTMDGSTIRSVVDKAQQVSPAAGETTTGQIPAPLPTELLDWAFTPEETGRFTDELAHYAQRASRYRFRIVRAHTGPLPQVPLRVSTDALAQFVMLYAQLATYRQVRSTYESVDMREFQGGRTECLRPNTSAAVELASALVRGDATVAQLEAALEAHRAQVKDCKSGQGIDRHLFGLAFTGPRHGLSTPIFEDPAHTALVTDFLSTTSLGETLSVTRIAFAPTSPGGIGIYYVTLDDHMEFSLSYVANETERIDEYAEALKAGATAIAALLARATS